MADTGVFLNLPSPAYSTYPYTDADGYLDSGATSDSTSPMPSSYDLTYVGGQVYASPESADGSAEARSTDTSAPQAKPSPKRKRENRYKNAPPSVLSRRRAQNRASQRAYRERKDMRIKDLETMLNEAQQRNDVLSQAYANLQAEYFRLKSEQEINSQCNQADIAFDPTIGGAPEMDMYLYQDMSNYNM